MTTGIFPVQEKDKTGHVQLKLDMFRHIKITCANPNKITYWNERNNCQVCGAFNSTNQGLSWTSILPKALWQPIKSFRIKCCEFIIPQTPTAILSKRI